MSSRTQQSPASIEKTSTQTATNGTPGVEKAQMRYRLGVDVGGTFTDLVLLDQATGEVRAGKTLTTPDDPSVGVQAGARRLVASAGLDPSQVEQVIHGTTLVGNVIIERKGRRTALITTAGFKDVLSLGLEFRYDIYDSHLTLASPLIPRRDRFEVAERITASGEVVLPLVEAAIDDTIAQVRAGEYEAVAICLLHSYRNNRHERLLADALRSVCPDLELSLSSEILPQSGEFERASATSMNAYVQPTVKTYLKRLGGRLRAESLPSDILCMASNGGLLTTSTAARYPIRLAESGPVAGALGAAYYGSVTGTSDLLAFDMGGTTAKACVLIGGTPAITNEVEIARVKRLTPGSGLPLRLPAVDMLEIGAGGGSIARVNDLGLLTVGPDSAGPDPGPVCYGKGGKDPTVTDADLVLGYLDPDYFLGGEMKLDLQGARDAIGGLADAAGLTPERTAAGIYEVVSQDMANAIRTHAIEKGVDYRKATLLAFGGAGPVHAYRVASLLGIERVLVPCNAGAFSAFGMLTVPLRFDVVRTLTAPVADLTDEECERVLAQLASELLLVLAPAGLHRDDVVLTQSVDVQYAGQGAVLEVPVPAQVSNRASAIAAAFSTLYSDRYGWALGGGALEIINWRCTAVGPPPAMPAIGVSAGSGGEAAPVMRSVYCPDARDYLQCEVFDRYGLDEEQGMINGPAIIQERESTVWIGSQGAARVDAHGSIVIDVQASR